MCAKFSTRSSTCLRPAGFDAGKKVKGRKRHILVDTVGLLLGVSVLPAIIQDRDGVSDLLGDVRRRFPFIKRVFADAGYQGSKGANDRRAGRLEDRDCQTLRSSSFRRLAQAMDRREDIRGSAAIGLSLATSNAIATTVAAFIRLAIIRLMLKRSTRPSH
jgi:hypothetical protein